MTGVIAWTFFRREFWTLLRSRRSQAVGLILLYALAAVPVLLAHPPVEVVEAVKSWFGVEAPFIVFLFVWIDVALNKTIVFLGALLSAGILVDERARNTLALYLSKPILPESYFATRALAAALVFASWYAVTVAAGLVTLPYRIIGFHAPTFLAMSAVHLFAGTFAVLLSAALSHACEKRLSAFLVSLLVLMLLVGLAFVPFYDRDLWWIGSLNPFYHAVSLFGELDGLTWGRVLRQIGLLLGWNGIALGFGIRRVSGMEL